MANNQRNDTNKKRQKSVLSYTFTIQKFRTMRSVLIGEICKEKPNAAAIVGAFNKAVKMTNNVIKNGNTGGETRAQILAYFKVSAQERSKKSRESFDNYNNTKYGR